MLGELIAGRIRAGLDASGKYTAVTFYPNSPLVLRARGAQGGLTQQEIDQVVDPRGVINQELALRVAAAMGTASVVLGSVEDYTFDAQANKADVTTTVQFLQVPSGTPIKTVGVTASATGPAGASQETVAQLVAAEVARRALSEMGVPAPAPAAASSMAEREKKRQSQEVTPAGRKRGWLAVGALLGILATVVK
jgi:hypothetical protein